MKFPAFLTKRCAIYIIINLDRSDHIGLNMIIVFFDRNIIQLLEHLPHKETVEIISAVTACQLVTIATSGIISISYEGCFPSQRLLSLVDNTLTSILYNWIPSRLFITIRHIPHIHESVNLQFVSKIERHALLFHDASTNKSPAMHKPFKTVW